MGKQKYEPEKKIGPFSGGVGVAIWLNEVQTDNGPKSFRSITISPRRYRDKETGEWKDGKSFGQADLPALLFALQKAQEYCYTVPVPGHEEGGDEPPY